MLEWMKAKLFKNRSSKAVAHTTYGLALVHIRRILSVLVLLISLLLILSESCRTNALLFICIIILLSILIHILDCLLISKEFDAILHNGTMVRGKLLSFVSQNGRRGFPCFEFNDKTGIHKVISLLPMAVSKKQQASYMGTYYNLWYAPGTSAYVLYGDQEPEPVPAHYFSFTLLSQLSIVLVFLMVLFFVSSPTSLTSSSINISWTSDYVPSSYSQSQIDCDTVQWFCTAYAMPTKSLSLDPVRIGGIDTKNFSLIMQVKQDLQKNYGVSSRKSAIQCLDTLLDTGTRSSYAETVAKLKKQDLFDLSRNDYLEKLSSYHEDLRYLAVYDAYHESGNAGIDAFDYCQALQLLGEYYVCGYINLEECLSHSLPIARKLQSEYTSWKSLGQSYLYGYEYFKRTETPEIHAMYERLEHYYEELFAEGAATSVVSYDIPLVDSWTS